MINSVIWRFLKKLKTELSYDPAIALLGIYPKDDSKGYMYSSVFVFKYFIYLFMRDREEEAGSMQGAQCGTRSRNSGIMP